MNYKKKRPNFFDKCSTFLKFLSSLYRLYRFLDRLDRLGVLDLLRDCIERMY